MRYSSPPGGQIEQSTGAFSIESVLDASELAVWNMNITTGQLDLPAELFSPLLSEAKAPITQLSQLLQLLPAADKYLFLQSFNADPADRDADRLRSCEVRLIGLAGEPRVRFVARLVTDTATRSFHGVVMSEQHWLANPGPEYASQLLSGLFAESPIPSCMTDKWGVILHFNQAVEQLFHLTHRQANAALGRYSILRDKHLVNDPVTLAAVKDVYRNGNIRTVELDYSLGNIHRNRFIHERNIYFRASFLPIKNKAGDIERVLIQMQDLSREKNTRDALQESEASYKAFVTNSSEATWCYEVRPHVDTSLSVDEQVMQIAANARLIEANKVLIAMLGASSLEEVVGLALTESGSTSYLFDLHKFIDNGYHLVDHDIVRQDRKGKSFYFQISCSGIVEDGQVKRVWGTTKDVTARKRYEDKLRYQSHHDALTALPNREKLYLDMEACFEQRNPEQISALLLIDLDRFKEINDTLGHNVGDHLLQLIGPRLANEMLEVPGTVARLGGDEFAVFLPRIRNTHQAVVFGHRILDALTQEFDLDGFCTQISASIGIAIAPHQAGDYHALMRYADIAMYHAKNQMLGLSIYNAEYDPHSPKRLSMIGELGRAIRENQLSLYFQPKVKLAEKRCYGFEALIRWVHPELGFVPPSEFIPIAELTSLIHPLTAWVLEKSIEQCRQWQHDGLTLSIAVNLSARNLMDDNIPKLVERLLGKYELPAACLELEITESAIMTDPARAMRILESLHALGVLLSIDDFGTGYSSLAYLKRLPVQTLKIDNSFVCNMLEDMQDELIVNSTINLAHNLGLSVVAEGVENAALLERLYAMGCDEAQGYFIGRPMAIVNANEWLVESGWVKTLTQDKEFF